MVTKLRPKQKMFAQEYVRNGGNGTRAVLAVYDTKNENVAGVIAYENLRNPNIEAEVSSLGFNAETAKGVVKSIMLDNTVDPNARLRATDQVFKVVGEYAPEKTVNLSLEMVDDSSFALLLESFNNANKSLEQVSEVKQLE
jgi:phage terminase small subunit